ncbi:MAG: peptide MFS transporter [Cryomorphaceae bacterium]|nr:peptide MFS transporter [Cryomorphaceae bacterium]
MALNKKSKLGSRPDVDIQTTGHPDGLFVLFFSEMWERFCYYGMRVLLTLYLVKSLMKGDAEASIIYGSYTALVYAAPVLGGKLADKFLGYRLAILMGAIFMAIGEFLILGGNEYWLIVGMGAIIVGNGYFKANISTIVGKLYRDDDPRRDSGFTIFYIGINMGALLATTLVAYVGETYGFKYGFGLAGIGMLAGFFIFWFGRHRYAHAEGLEVRPEGRKKIIGPFNMVHLIILGTLAFIPLCFLLISQNQIMMYLLLGVFVIVGFQLIAAGAKEGGVWKDRMIALVIMMLINVVFWACFEQAGTSLTLFADRNVDRNVMGWLMPASMTQFFNPAFIIIFGSIFSVMWVKLTKIGKNPSIPMKFSLGILQLGLGFLVTIIGLQMESAFKVPLLTLVILYLLHTTGELFLSPIGLSMVTKLSPKNIAGTAMGGWFLSFAMANFLAGQIAGLTGAKEEDDPYKKVKEITISKALESSEYTFEDWVKLDGFAPNINLGEYNKVADWVAFRVAKQEDLAIGHFMELREEIMIDLDNQDDWLNPDRWTALNEAILDIRKSDSIAKANDAVIPNIDFKSYVYYRFNGVDYDLSTRMDEVYQAQILHINEVSLKKYVKVFSVLGYVLLGVSVLIALFTKPLNKLMHGVK